MAGVTVFSVPARVAGTDKFEATIDDYTDGNSAVGARHLTGKWSVHLKGTSGKGDFTASIAMIRPGSGASPHTHHLLLENATVTQLATRWSLQGQPTITSNRAAAFAGSTVTVELTGEGRHAAEFYPIAQQEDHDGRFAPITMNTRACDEWPALAGHRAWHERACTRHREVLALVQARSCHARRHAVRRTPLPDDPPLCCRLRERRDGRQCRHRGFKAS